MLAIGGGVLLTVLASQVLRLEPAAPHLPLVARRSLDPRAAAVHRELIRVRRALDAARKTAAGPHQALARTLEKMHQEQEKVLVARLLEFEENPEEKDRFPAVAQAGEGLLLAESAGLSAEELSELGSIAPEDLGLLLSLRVQRTITLPALGLSPESPRTPTVVGAPEAARIIGSLRATEHALSIAAARSTEPARGRIAIALNWAQMTRLRLQPSAGDEKIPGPSGYPLPAPIPDDESAIALCKRALSALTGGILAEAPAASGNVPALASLITWAAAAETHAQSFGTQPRAFPGLILT
ncbi:hypothetical protein [Austwickia chelonae]|uniref:hypothetical protein n=1 Tax=Austwickia chelonae TaxID=100225 RepID=UPI0013C30776|nr:hypothetical protein [Austwickia chelonae]